MHHLLIKFAAVLALTALLAGCDMVDTMKEGVDHSQAVAARLEKDVGLHAEVGFNWNNGSLTKVTIVFDGVPPATVPMALLADKAKAAVAAEFKQQPQVIILAFNVTP